MSEAQRTRESPSYRSVIGVAVLVLLGLLATAGVKSYRDLKVARDLEADLKQRIAASESRIHVLSDYVRMIEEDPLTLERLAREDLGLVKPGDAVIVLPEGGAARPEPALRTSVPLEAVRPPAEGGRDDAREAGEVPRFPIRRSNS